MKNVFSSFTRRVKPILFAVALLATVPSLQAGTWTVTNTRDDAGIVAQGDPNTSLRQAILSVNASTDPSNNISFNIPGTGPFRIQPLTLLPQINRKVTIDGYTQPGSSVNTLEQGTDAVLMIELNGSNYTVGTSAQGRGLNFQISGANTSSGSIVRGLVINEWIEAGIIVGGNGGLNKNFTFVGNFIGTDVTGTKQLANSEGIRFNNGNGGIVGTPALADRNLIAGNFVFETGAIQITNTPNYTIQNNLIGTDRTGTIALGNMFVGVFVNGQAGNSGLIGGLNPGEGNVISGATDAGIYAENTSGLNIYGNYIGTDVTGTQSVGNLSEGIYVVNNLANANIQILNNLISGNGGARDSSHSQQCDNEVNAFPTSGNGIVLGTINPGIPQLTTIQGNLIGVDVTGKKALPNEGDGIWVGINGVIIGGSSETQRNVISGNGRNGIVLLGVGATNIPVLGNFIGTDITGTQAIGNGLNGVLLGKAGGKAASISNFIGGVNPGEGNLISGNHKNGVQIKGFSTGNLIRGNLIGTDITGNNPLPNHGSGVDVIYSFGNTIGGLSSIAGNIIAFNKVNGVVIGANAQDNDSINNAILTNSIFHNKGLGIFIPDSPLGTGPNQGILSPKITSATAVDGTITVTGKLSGVASSSYLIQFFSTSSSGEGKTFLNQLVITTDANGQADFTAAISGEAKFITATASLGGLSPTETSEFSKPKKIKS